MVPVLQTARKAFGRYLGGIKKATAPYGFDYRKELMLWNFTDEDTLKKWDCICDDEVGGKSNAQFEPNGKGAEKQLYPSNPLFSVCLIYTAT